MKKIYNYLKNIHTNIKNNIEIFAFTVILVFKLMLFDATIRGFSETLLESFYMLIISTGTVLVLCSWTMLFKRKLKIILLIILDLICSFVMLSDLYFYRYYSDFISVPTLAHAFLLGSVKSSIFEMINIKDVMYIFDICILFIVVFISFKHNKLKIAESFSHRKRIAHFISTFFIGLLLITIRVSALTGNDIYSWAFERYFFVSNMNILNYHAYDIYEYNLKKYEIKKPLVDTKKEEVKKWFDDLNASKSPKNTLTGIAKDKNLIMIQVEALQQFVINRKVNNQEITPNLNKLIKNSLYFDNYYYQTAQGNTSDAEFVSNTSLFPLEQGAVYFNYPTNNYKSIGNSLKEAGYDTAAIHGYKGGFWNRSVIYPNLGFNMFYSLERLNYDDNIGLGLSDKSMLNQSVDIIKNMKQPYFTFLVTLSSHYPYDALKNVPDTLDTGEYNGTFLGNYLKCINYTDAALGDFISRLDEEGILDNSVVVLYGDHFAIDTDHKAELSKFIGIDMNSEVEWLKQQKVPMLIHLPNSTSKGAIHTIGGQVDLFPTLANLFDLNKDDLLGNDLLDIKQNSVVLRNGTVTDGKIIYSPFSNKVYNFKTGEEMNMQDYKPLIDTEENKLKMSDLVISKNLMNFLQGKNK